MPEGFLAAYALVFKAIFIGLLVMVCLNWHRIGVTVIGSKRDREAFFRPSQSERSGSSRGAGGLSKGVRLLWRRLCTLAPKPRLALVLASVLAYRVFGRNKD